MSIHAATDLTPPVEISDPEWARLVPDGSVLSDAREERGLSREAIARLIGCSAGSIDNWERGTVPTRTLRARVLRAYGIDPSGAGEDGAGR